MECEPHCVGRDDLPELCAPLLPARIDTGFVAADHGSRTQEPEGAIGADSPGVTTIAKGAWRFDMDQIWRVQGAA